MPKLGPLAMMMMALVVAGCTSSTAPRPHPQYATGAVAWVSTPASPTTSTTTTTTTLVAAPPCSVSVLRARAGPGGAGLGNYVVPVYLTNIGKVTCRLSGYPTLTAIASSGERVAVKTQHGTYFGNMTAADLHPGARGEFLLAGVDACLNAPTTTVPPIIYRAVVVGLPNNGGSITTKSFPLCGYTDGFWESQLGVTPPVPGVFVPVPGTPASLQARVELPARVEGGPCPPLQRGPLEPRFPSSDVLAVPRLHRVPHLGQRLKGSGPYLVLRTQLSGHRPPRSWQDGKVRDGDDGAEGVAGMGREVLLGTRYRQRPVRRDRRQRRPMSASTSLGSP